MKTVTAAPPEKRDAAPPSQVGDEHPLRRVALGWRASCSWVMFICIWYLALQNSLSAFVKHDPEARLTLLNIVPFHVYRYSEAAFAVATVLNLLNMIFEETPNKQQLGMLSAVIKGLSWHADHLIVSGRAIVKFDYHGALLMPSRYVQWSCSTPTMIFTVSRISNMDPKSIAIAMGADWLMVVTGYLASETPWWMGVWFLAASFLCMIFVLKQLKLMLDDALAEADTEHARRCLKFTLYSTMVIWSLFPMGWVASHITIIPAIAAWGEPISIFANFSAKVVFSTSIMYNNFVTLAERRRAVRIAAEHKERIQAVHDLTDAVGRKDAFLEVVAHELRTPLNAICQLSVALGVGAGGPLAQQAKEWIGTIKASAAHLLGVVNDILTFRAGQVTGLVVKQELVNVAEVLDEVLRTLLPSAGQGVTLEKVIHARLPLIVADRRRIVLALTNLVANSIKFMDKPTGKVTVKAYPDRGGRHVVIKVTDSGPGLSAKQLAQLGDAGLGTVDAGKRRAGGLGLGLPITFQLVQAHGGALRITSPGLGMGTTALIRLPVLQAITDCALQQQFVSAYSAMGYSLEQLLSPELAVSEGRACPVFADVLRPTISTTAPTLAAHAFSTAPSVSMPQPQPIVPPSFVHNAPQLQRQLQPSLSTTSSVTSSLDLGSNVYTYHWHAPTMDASGNLPTTVANPFANSHGSNQAMQTLQQVDDHNPARPSEESLAAWEAYAESMGYTLPNNTQHDNGPASQASVSLSAGQLSGIASPNPLLTPNLSGAASARGVPGQAVALMSSLFTPSAQVSAAMGSSSRKTRAMAAKGNRSSTSSARMSIEECDEEGQEDEVPPNKAKRGSSPPPGQRASVEVVGTPTRGSGNNFGPPRYSEDASQALFESAAMATAMVTSMASGSIAQELADGNKSGPLYVEAPDWDAYLQTGDEDAGSVCRTESEAVVAANARLSIQYQAAVAEAAKTGGKVDAKWQTWVSRIPEHHKAALGVGKPTDSMPPPC